MKIILTVLTIILAQVATAQESTDSKLYKDLKAADSLLFERGFNHCDYDALEKLAHRDLQFVHDQGGMQNRTEFFEAVGKNICNGKSAKPYRKLIDGSLSVYPLYNNGKLYGAIQMGGHEFYTVENGQMSRNTTVAKFIHTWLTEDGKWQLYRVLSFDHQPKTAK